MPNQNHTMNSISYIEKQKNKKNLINKQFGQVIDFNRKVLVILSTKKKARKFTATFGSFQHRHIGDTQILLPIFLLPKHIPWNKSFTFSKIFVRYTKYKHFSMIIYVNIAMVSANLQWFLQKKKK